MAYLPAGIFSAPRGVFGPQIFRTKPGGVSTIGPRYHPDKKTPAQLEQRRRLSTLSTILSKVYLALLRPHYHDRRSPYTALDYSIHLSMTPYREFYGMPYMRLYNVPIDPRPWLAIEERNPPHWMWADWQFFEPMVPHGYTHIQIMMCQHLPHLRVLYSVPIEWSVGSIALCPYAPLSETFVTAVIAHAMKKVGRNWTFSRQHSTIWSLPKIEMIGE